MNKIREVKSGQKDFDKILSDVTKQMRNLQSSVEMTNGPLKSEDVSEGEFKFSSVIKDSQAPGSPAADEGRLYFKINGVLYQLTGSKVG